jgi:hypothetical protein
MAKLPRKLKRKRKQKSDTDPAVVMAVLVKIEDAKAEVLAKHQIKKLPAQLEEFFAAVKSRGRALMTTGSIHGWN